MDVSAFLRIDITLNYSAITLFLLKTASVDFQRGSVFSWHLSVIKHALNSDFKYLSKQRTAWKYILIMLILSLLMSMFYLTRTDFVELPNRWVPADHCGFPTNFSMPEYNFVSGDSFFSAKWLFETFVILDGIFKIVPAILLPIFALLLVRQSKIAEHASRKVSNSRSKNEESKTDHTSRLVILMTIASIIAEGPLGIVYVIQGLATNYQGLLSIINDIIAILLVFVTLNATTHFFICIGVSTMYIKTVKEIFGQKKQSKAISITPKASTTSVASIRQIHVRVDVSITEFQCVVACVGVIVNLFHLLVLTRKSMSMNSINMIMIGIALCDMFNMSFNVYDTAQILVQTSDKCRPPAPYTVKLIGFWASACEDHSRRLSALFGVMMALIRWLIIKNALNPKYEKFSKSLFAFGAMLVAFLLSSIMTLLFWSRYEVAQVGLWRPPIECTGFPIDYSVPVYKSSVDNIFMTDTSVALQVFSVVDGLIKLIPTAMFPVLTFLLVKELKKAASSRRKVSTVKNEEENSKSEQATRLVILMAITYILSEGPLGIIYVIQGFVMEPPGLVEMTFDLLDIFDVFVSINSISHCFICLGVSSQYRKSAKSLFFCVKCLRRKTKPLPIATKVSVSSAGRVRKTTVDPTAD